ncbi:MAG TPA: NAD(P)/FAD-dependent oxidoreductase [bacterium]|jgi:L-2-hydroxyglutarate oxidase LhgO
MSTDYQFAVIGAGVVGLAIAAELAPRGSVLVLEKEWKFGQATSSHNSEVVHGGLYYAPGSLKARLCVEGNRLIRDLAAQHGIGYKQVGKFIVVASAEERAYLESLKANAEANGVTDLRWVPLEELQEQEPDVRAVACLFSPTTGIVDSHALMAHFKTSAELSGADFVFNAEVTGITQFPPVHGGARGGEARGARGGEPGGADADATSSFIPHPSSFILHPSSFILAIRDSDGAEIEISAEKVINAAGLHSDEIARLAGLDVDGLDLNLNWTRGFYYALESGPRLHISHLVYPVPDKSLKSLGIHATVDLQGQVRFGPTAEYMPRRVEDYSFNGLDDIALVRESIARYLPAVAAAELAPIMTGIRPKLASPGQPPRDFYICEESAHGLPGFVNLIGIESPGLTAAPAIAKLVSTMIRDL